MEENIRPKIAVIGLKGLPSFGGAATVGENIIETLKGKFNFTVYSISSHTHLKTGEYNGYKQIVFKKIPFKKINTLYYYTLSALHSLFLGNYDLIHIHHRDASFILPILKIRYKIVLTTHGMVLTEKWSSFHGFFVLQDILFLRFANYITCVSKKDFSIASNFKKKNTIHIPNGINLNVYSLEQNPQRNFMLFAAGRIVPSKGCHIFLKSLKQINYAGKVKIIGDCHQMDNYRKLLEGLACGLNVEFTGLIKNKELLFREILSAKIFIYPSKIESMSMMLLEVASLKTPIICSDIQENRDIFDGSEVLYFNTDNVEDLSEKILWAMTHSYEMEIKAGKAFKKLIDHYNWKMISDEYDTIYKKLLQNCS